MESRAGPDGSPATAEGRRGMFAVAAMMFLFFLVVLAVGILRPVRAALALDGLALGDFYQVYVVSAVVVAFVPLVNRLSDRVPWRRLIPAVALFFSLNLLIFRALYEDGSTLFGLVFYGWYDLFVAALVVQFFMITQMFFHARLAKNAYPIVIAGGSLGAVLGGGIAGFLAEQVGTPNLLLVAAVPIALFSVAIPAVWAVAAPEPEKAPRRRRIRQAGGGGDLRAIVTDRQVQLIAGIVLITILVKQVVDYQFQTVTKEVFATRDAITAFQGKFYAAVNWLPILALAGMKPVLRRWGVGLVVLIFPVAMLLTNVGLILFWSLWIAAAARGAETTLRYSVERATREILYVPIPDELKLKAKNYIDAALERGVGKLISAGLIGLLVGGIGLQYRQVAWLGAGLAVIWILLALRVRKEYVESLARSVEERFASFRGAFASLEDATTRRVIREALQGDPRQVAFALDLVEQAPPAQAEDLASEIEALLDHPSTEIRKRALALLGRTPHAVPASTFRRNLRDPSPGVREAAVRGLYERRDGSGVELVTELLESDAPAVRTAVLVCLARGEIRAPELPLGRHFSDRDGEGGEESGREDRMERALVAAALRPPGAVETLRTLMGDPDPEVVATALRGAGWLGDPRLHSGLLGALARRDVREAAREALEVQGTSVVPYLAERLVDQGVPRAVRRQIPPVLARIPAPETVDALVRCILAPETDQILDHRSMKALSKLRARNPDLSFDPDQVERLLDRAVRVCERLARVRRGLMATGGGGRVARLLQSALAEAWEERREEAFRCLGLLHPPAEIHRCHMAVVRSEAGPRAEALEWLESTVGYHTFQRLGPLLDEGAQASEAGDFGAELEHLARDEDRWLSHLAAHAASELGFRSPPPPEHLAGETSMDLVEAVFLLQQVDVLRDARSDHLALVASVAEEVDADAGAVLLPEGEVTEALYVVVRGQVTLTGAGRDLELSEGMAFGTWALIDEVPSVVEARATRPTRLLRIGREDFHDLMVDYPELAIGMLQGLARRIRTLVN